MIALFLSLCDWDFSVYFFEFLSGWLFFSFYFFSDFAFSSFNIGWRNLFTSEIKKIYEDVRILDENNFLKPSITTDMEVLTREVERFAKDKKLEIETLKIRENYRKEFMGNISHELKTPLFTVQGYILTLVRWRNKR